MYANQQFNSGEGRFVTEDDARDNFEKELRLEQTLKMAKRQFKSK
jgi:hypothetical protein